MVFQRNWDNNGLRRSETFLASKRYRTPVIRYSTDEACLNAFQGDSVCLNALKDPRQSQKLPCKAKSAVNPPTTVSTHPSTWNEML